MRPIPDWPAHNAFQVFSTPIPSGVTNPKPVTTTRLGWYAPIPHPDLKFLLNILDGFSHRQDLFGVLIRNFDVEGLLERHNQLDGVQRIGTEVVHKFRIRDDIV